MNPVAGYEGLDAICDRALSEITDRELRRGIGSVFAEAARRARSGDVDVVLMAARRMDCLYELLVQEGMPELDDCLVVSDRVLEATLDFEWLGAKVLVLDDSVVVGTTLYQLHDEIGDRVGDEGRVSFLCVCLDRQQRAPYLVDALSIETQYERSSDEVRQFATSIVQSLFRGVTPFFSDYPVTRPLRTTTSRWTDFLSDPDWHFADVTAPLLDTPHQYALAQIPTQRRFDGILSRVPAELGALVDVLKVRHYVRESESGVESVIVPIALLAPCRPSELDDAFESLSGHAERADLDALDWKGWRPEAKHRFLQLVASTYVLADVWPAVARIGAKQTAVGMLSPVPLRLYFGDRYEAAIVVLEALANAYDATPPGTYPLPLSLRLDQPPPSELFSRAGVSEMLWDTRELVSELLPGPPSIGKLTKLGLVFSHAMASLFGFVYRKHELQQRDEIRGLDSLETYKGAFVRDPSRRLLNQGLTMRELAAALMPGTIGGDSWRRSLVSLGIDPGNDLGVIVPVTRWSPGRGVVYRCYRLGETAHLAQWPLVMAFDADQEQLDEMSLAVERGFPVQTESVPVDERQSLRPDAYSPKPSDARALLRGVRYEALPGEVVSRFDGTVTAVGKRRFDAILRSPAGGQQTASLVIKNQLPDTQREMLRPGARFSWSVLERDRPGGRDLVSRIRLRPMPAVDVARLDRASEVLAGLLGDEPDAT